MLKIVIPNTIISTVRRNLSAVVTELNQNTFSLTTGPSTQSKILQKLTGKFKVPQVDNKILKLNSVDAGLSIELNDEYICDLIDCVGKYLVKSVPSMVTVNKLSTKMKSELISIKNEYSKPEVPIEVITKIVKEPPVNVPRPWIISPVINTFCNINGKIISDVNYYKNEQFTKTIPALIVNELLSGPVSELSQKHNVPVKVIKLIQAMFNPQ